MDHLHVMLVDTEFIDGGRKDVLYFLTEEFNDVPISNDKNASFYTIRPINNGEKTVGGSTRICKKEDEFKVRQEMIRKHAREIKKEKESVSRKIWRIHRMLDKENCSLNFTL